MSKRILPRGGDGIWYFFVVVLGFIASGFMAAGMWYIGLPLLGLMFYCLNRAYDFDDLYRD